MRLPLRTIALVLTLALGLVASACGGDSETATADDQTGATSGPDIGQLSTVTPDEAATLHETPPADLVVLDVRTPEEFAEGHLDGAVMVDFYAPTSPTRSHSWDANVPYLLYCRSGNRSGQTLSLMQQMGFTDVTEVDGGIAAWQQAGHPVTTP